MSSFGKVLCSPAAIAFALLAFACQNDSNAVFDNEGLDGSGASVATGGSPASGGDGNTAASATGGSSAQAGKGGSGAKAGSGGQAEAGSPSEAGSENGGSAGSSGSGGDGGSTAGKAGAAGTGGTGGTKPDPEPEPVTIDITDFEDTYVATCEMFTDHGDDNIITMDSGFECTYQTLMSVALDKIPDGAVVSNATLTLTCTDPGGLINVNYAGGAWTESGARWGNKPQVGTSIGTMICEEAGKVTLDLTTAVLAWVGGTPNHGFYLRTETDAGTDFASSEANTSGNRPVLSVTYTLPLK